VAAAAKGGWVGPSKRYENSKTVRCRTLCKDKKKEDLTFDQKKKKKKKKKKRKKKNTNTV